MRRLPTPALLGLALIALPPLSAGAQQARVVALDDVFDPTNPKLPVGTTVTFVNQGDTPHTVTADDESFDSGDLTPGRRSR